VKIILLSLNHELQWKDPTGDLRRILSELLATLQIDLIAEEAFGLPSTVGQRLACKLDKPWIDIDMSTAERRLAGIGEPIERWGVLEESGKMVEVFRYVPEFDDVREEHWLGRLLRWKAQTAVCLCGHLHVESFTKKLEEKGCTVEHLNLTEQSWFRELKGFIPS
jgi:hypothetical protein